jgi:hypothetical protein
VRRRRKFNMIVNSGLKVNRVVWPDAKVIIVVRPEAEFFKPGWHMVVCVPPYIWPKSIQPGYIISLKHLRALSRHTPCAWSSLNYRRNIPLACFYLQVITISNPPPIASKYASLNAQLALANFTKEIKFETHSTIINHTFYGTFNE